MGLLSRIGKKAPVPAKDDGGIACQPAKKKPSRSRPSWLHIPKPWKGKPAKEEKERFSLTQMAELQQDTRLIVLFCSSISIAAARRP